MKSYRLYLLSLFTILFILVYNNIIIAEKLDNDYLTSLLNERTVTINEVLCKEKNLNEGKRILKTIEKGKCLEEDIRFLEDAKRNPTDFAYVKKCKILNIDNIKRDENIITYILVIRWYLIKNTLKENNTEEIIEVKYKLGIERYKEHYYIIDLEPLTNSQI